MSSKYINLKLSSQGPEGWQLVVTDADTGKLLPISAIAPVTIRYTGAKNPIAIECQLILAPGNNHENHEIDIVGEANYGSTNA